MIRKRSAAILTGLAGALAAALLAVPGWFEDAAAHEPELSRYNLLARYPAVDGETLRLLSFGRRPRAREI